VGIGNGSCVNNTFGDFELMTESLWPDYYPEDCPPEDCEDCAGRFYRLVERNPPDETDFIPNYLLFPDREDCRTCTGAGLSVFGTEKSARNLRQLPVFRDHFVAVVVLPSSAGKMKRGNAKNRHHCTWWVCDKVSPLGFVVQVLEKS
jgi:hypothetical protein